MVRAILEGRKTQTRRIVKLADGGHAQNEDIPAHGECDGIVIPPPDYVMDFSKHFPQWKRMECPYGQPGDRLWVRETHYVESAPGNWYTGFILYKANDEHAPVSKWRPSIHMPRWASRITLEVVSVRVERLHDISEEDAKAEGVHSDAVVTADGSDYRGLFAYDRFAELWQSINGTGSWDANPWVWVVEFKRIKP